MKATIVGFLAVLALSGCGVGVDDPEGEQAIAQSSAGLMLVKTVAPPPEFVTAPRAGPRTALPQDPTPMSQGKPIAPGSNEPDPRPTK
jgi:uncharacterized lipoprotein